MSKSFRQQSRARAAMSRSRSRSRSVTPGPGQSSRRDAGAGARRSLLLEMVASGPVRPPREEDEEPWQWKPNVSIGFPAPETLGEPDFLAPSGIRPTRRTLPVKTALQHSIHAAPVERAAEMGLDEEEGATAVVLNLDHVRKWLGDLASPGHAVPAPHVCRTPSPPGADMDVLSGISSLPEPQAQPSNPCGTSAAVPVVDDVRPSTSGIGGPSRPSAALDNLGSELDSDFDDEFDFEAIAANVGANRDVPEDTDLTEPEVMAVNVLTTAMDEVADRLPNVSVDFTWQYNFDTFLGVLPTPGPINDYDTPYEAFTAIWSKDFMGHIVQETNKYAKQTIDAAQAAGRIGRSSRLHRWESTDINEMYVFFCVYILMGLAPRSSQHEYWKTNCILEMPNFRKLLSYNSYILLSKFMHFTDNRARDLPRNATACSAKLAKLQPVIDHLNSKFSKLYNLQQDVAIDESLTLFKGRLSWVQAIRSKAARFGIKSYELCESKTGYLWKFEIYTGKNSERENITAPSVDLAGKSTEVVLDLLKDLKNRGHLVTMDNFYNCPALARYLKSLGFDCLGTLRPNRKHVPVEIAKAPKDVPKGTIIARHSGDVSCIAWKDSKLVCMISTYHTAETFVGRKAGQNLVKPVAVRDYNNTMGGVDLKDQKLSMYLVERKRCVKWYMKMFKRMLNTSVLNAFIMLTGSLKRRNKPLLAHRNFRLELAESLAAQHGHVLPLAEVPSRRVARLSSDVRHVVQRTSHSDRGYCHICRRNGKKEKTNNWCSGCVEFICPGNCWEVWHYSQELPGRDVRTRDGSRRGR